MRITDEGLALIKEFEGFRANAYRDAVGVWTVGYGHTSMAGEPKVTPDLVVTKQQGTDILRKDVEMFARGVRESVHVPLSDQQFSALVSFAYNVGLGGFRTSSVLKAVNARDFAAVPRRLNLWVKAGGRTLPGLVRRRAAEGALFLAGGEAKPAEAVVRPVEVAKAKPARQSRTIWGALAAVLLAVLQALYAATVDLVVALLIVGVLVVAGVIIWERLKKMKWEGV